MFFVAYSYVQLCHYSNKHLKVIGLFHFTLQSVHEKHLGVEFQSEVQTLSRIEHLNLVRFYGFSEQGDERIIVVEYVPNGTLREHLDCEFL